MLDFEVSASHIFSRSMQSEAYINISNCKALNIRTCEKVRTNFYFTYCPLYAIPVWVFFLTLQSRYVPQIPSSRSRDRGQAWHLDSILEIVSWYPYIWYLSSDTCVPSYITPDELERAHLPIIYIELRISTILTVTLYLGGELYCTRTSKISVFASSWRLFMISNNIMLYESWLCKYHLSLFGRMSLGQLFPFSPFNRYLIWICRPYIILIEKSLRGFGFIGSFVG